MSAPLFLAVDQETDGARWDAAVAAFGERDVVAGNVAMMDVEWSRAIIAVATHGGGDKAVLPDLRRRLAVALADAARLALAGNRHLQAVARQDCGLAAVMRIVGRGVQAAAVATVMLCVPFEAADAHQAASGWQYPFECCSGQDCYEIDKDDLVEASGGWIIKATGEFRSVDTVRISPDGHYHRCSYGGRREAGTICLFVPAMGS